MATVHGYAFRFNEIVEPFSGGGKLLVRPGAFVLPGDAGGAFGSDYAIKLYWREDAGAGAGCPTIGTTADGSLRFEQNDQGLYFEWTPGKGDRARRALDAVSEWRLNGACIGLPRLRESYFRDDVEVITGTYVGGMTLTRLGCSPGTGCKVMTGARLFGDPDLVGVRRTVGEVTGQ